MHIWTGLETGPDRNRTGPKPDRTGTGPEPDWTGTGPEPELDRNRTGTGPDWNWTGRPELDRNRIVQSTVQSTVQPTVQSGPVQFPSGSGSGPVSVRFWYPVQFGSDPVRSVRSGIRSGLVRYPVRLRGLLNCRAGSRWVAPGPGGSRGVRRRRWVATHPQRPTRQNGTQRNENATRTRERPQDPKPKHPGIP